LLAALALWMGTAAPGPVVLAGKGARIEGPLRAELGADRRVVLSLKTAGIAEDPFAGSGTEPLRFELDPSVEFAGDAREPAEAVRGARCVVLAGGSFLDWYRVMTPSDATTRLSEATRETHAAGAAIVGAGPAAPFLARWARVERSALGKPERNPRRHREDVAVRGLGFLEDLLVDTSADPRADPARALRPAFDSGIGQVLFLDGPSIWIADPRERTARVAGGGTAIVFDLEAGRRQRDAWREARLSLLSAGDSWSARGGGRCAGGVATVAPGPQVEALRASLERAGARLSVRSDERTLARDPAGGDAGCSSSLEIDVEWAPRGS